MDILLVDRLVPEALAWLQERYGVESRGDLAADPSALRKAVYKARAVVLPRKVVVTQEFLDFAPMLKAVARMHVGTDNTDLEACRARKVRVIQSSTANVRSNAEYLLASLLMLYRRGIGAAVNGDRHAEIRLGRELSGSVVGILGLGPTAHTLALMLHSLGARLIGYDPAVHHTAPIWARLKIQPVGLQELVANADSISVQVMYASRYQGFINDKLLAHCKPGQLWVGISRSHLYDAHAFARALNDGRIEAALLDGAESGFASRGSPLHECGNLFLTPRLGSHTREARLRASWYVAHRIHETLSEPGSAVFEPTPTGTMDLGV
ncbi:NAD(P)-dependent oxidoreductase [Ramlibacter sp.]|uniref:NAD(P)-dependent oxidoreductase n=1 Tax=Ramlibacter sp. TaxID=1917967 RepID=UPI002FC5DEA7